MAEFPGYGFHGHVSANEFFARDGRPPFRMDVEEIHHARDPPDYGYGYQNGNLGNIDNNYEGQRASSSYVYGHERYFEQPRNNNDRTNTYGYQNVTPPFSMDREEISPQETLVEIRLSNTARTLDVSSLSSKLYYDYEMHCQSSGRNAITVTTGRTGYGAKKVLDIVKEISGDSGAKLAHCA